MAAAKRKQYTAVSEDKKISNFNKYENFLLVFLEKFWLDDVICQGDETSLSRCAFKRWGASDCKKDEAAGVKCLNGTKSSNLMRRKTRGKKLHEVLDIRNASMRLVGGRDFREGRVEVRTNYT